MKTKKNHSPHINDCNIYNTFEDKIEKVFKENGLNFHSINNALEKQLMNQFKEAVKPPTTTISPGNDFYSFINEKWLKDFEVEKRQKYIVQVDNFRLVQDKVYQELLKFIEDNINNKHTTFSQNMKKMYESTNKTGTKMHTILKHVNDYLLYLKTNNCLWNLLGTINQNEIISWGSPLVWSLNPDDKQPDIYRCCLSGPTLTLIDLNVYFDDGTNVEYKSNYKKKYLHYLNELFEFIFGKNHGYNVNDIFDVEVKLVNTFVCDDNSNPNNEQSSENFFKISKKEAYDKYGLDWNTLSKAIGFNEPPDFFIVSDNNFLECMIKLLKNEWNTDKWNTYWIYIYIRQIARFTNKGGEIYYNFNGHFVRGMDKIVDNHLYRIFPLAFAYNNFLTQSYVEVNKNIRTMNYVKTLAEDLITVFKRIIFRNTWLQPETKKKALIKLENIKLEVGYPTNLREDPNIIYSSDDIWDNLIKIANWRVKQAVQLEGKPLIDIAVIDWSKIPPKFISKQAYVVNAFYTPIENSIYIPLGYIQKPFIDLDERGKEYNLSQIGFTISHEMSHSLDDKGSKYDEHGKLYNWWTVKDKKKFKEIQNNIIKQYETFALYDGIKFDASLSIGEDLADISGLNICLEYLRDFQLKNQVILPIQKLSFNMFFVYFAIQQRQLISKKSIDAQLKTNPHPLNKYRCNVPLSRIPIFRILYNITKKDKMWWNSTNRVWEN
jgi:predicted metalloendopeptidase